MLPKAIINIIQSYLARRRRMSLDMYMRIPDHVIRCSRYKYLDMHMYGIPRNRLNIEFLEEVRHVL